MSDNTNPLSPTTPKKQKKMSPPPLVRKRDGRVVPYDEGRIVYALKRCYQSINLEPNLSFEKLASMVTNLLAAKNQDIASVEDVQNAVENLLYANGEFEAAKSYIIYRVQHEKERAERPIPGEVRELFDSAAKYFPTEIQKHTFFDKYARFDHKLGRRETWVETVDRTVNYLKELSNNKLKESVYQRIRQSILSAPTTKGGATPSMRLLAMAGDAARRQPASIYNCTYLPCDSIESFVEALVLSMAGCGVGFSVEKNYVENLPRVKRQKGGRARIFVVPDTTEGWAEALRAGLNAWFGGNDVEFDYSQVRPAGTPLKVKGGYASGPEPLRIMLSFIRSRVMSRQGGFLRPLDAHDIMCAIGGASIAGGTRRTAMISLFDFDDQEMRHCKDGDFANFNPQRWNANNSMVWPDRPLSQAEIMRILLDTFESGRGEPGIFNRRAAQLSIPERRQQAEFGMNPCGEIILRPYECCNLSSVICRTDDTMEDLLEKVEVATIIGTIQSLASNFANVREIWRQNAEEERLLGVDLNGQLDCPLVQDSEVMQELKQHAVEVNRRYAKLLGINQAAAVTCVKPSGNSSVLFNTSSGIHTRWSRYYIRNVRVGAKSVLLKVLKDAGVPMDPENGQRREDATTWVVHFPVKAPDGAITRNDRSAIQQANYWLQNKTNWTEHNPSATITYREDEVLDLAKWVWKNQEKINGLTFLPTTDAVYDQMPYVEISKDEYERLAEKFPVIDFSKIYRYEMKDTTTASQEVACMGGQCEVA